LICFVWLLRSVSNVLIFCLFFTGGFSHVSTLQAKLKFPFVIIDALFNIIFLLKTYIGTFLFYSYWGLIQRGEFFWVFCIWFSSFLWLNDIIFWTHYSDFLVYKWTVYMHLKCVILCNSVCVCPDHSTCSYKCVTINTLNV
jgi:hypothetical protein